MLVWPNYLSRCMTSCFRVNQHLKWLWSWLRLNFILNITFSIKDSLWDDNLDWPKYKVGTKLNPRNTFWSKIIKFCWNSLVWVLKLQYADASRHCTLNPALSSKYSCRYKYLLDMLVFCHACDKSSYLTLQSPAFVIGASCLAVKISASSLRGVRVVYKLFLK
jgi:hypothetical protein